MPQFWGGRKPEYPEETLEVRLTFTETQSTYNKSFVVGVEGVIDVHYASLTSFLLLKLFIIKLFSKIVFPWYLAIIKWF